MLSVNMPPTTTPETPRCLAGMTPTGYGSYFAPEGEGRFAYRFSGLRVFGTDGRGDIAVLERGEVAITPVRLSLDVELDADDRRRFERGVQGCRDGTDREE